MKKLIYGLLIILAVLHQDFWWWDRAEPLVFGFMPISLAWHAGISLTAALLWALAVWYCWPLSEHDRSIAAQEVASGGDGR